MEREGKYQPNQFPKWENLGPEAQQELTEAYENSVRMLAEKGIPLELAGVVVSGVIKYSQEIIGQAAILGMNHFSEAADEIASIQEQRNFSEDEVKNAMEELKTHFLDRIRKVGQALGSKSEPEIKPDEDIWG